ncbi:MAG: aspartate aminotransferase family protein [Rhodobacteraceae bacterium]|jgi:glutamate-1-semialdehyde 2,1-aminomutase|nr:aspartate aminotransferase family protein [Paracoccaceae bacterium]
MQIAGIDAKRLNKLRDHEAKRYAAGRPLSRAAQSGAWLSGVPMHWMTDWPMPFPMVVARAKGARLTCVDGFELDDFCLGDTGSMFGHAPAPVAKAIAAQAKAGLTYMLPSADAAEAGRLLTEVFGDFRWQIATTATDANRFALRVARAVTGRPKVLVFNGCYHGTIDDAMVALEGGQTVNRPGLLGQVADLTKGAVCVEFNDLAGVEAALAKGDVACVLTEPVMTNSCMVLPAPGFLQGLRDLCTRYGTLLTIDETHTISTGLGGYTRVHGLNPDIFVAGKCVAGGMPTAIWGLRPDLAARYAAANAARAPGHSGMGTTLSANPMQFACLKATLADVMTAENYAHMDALANRLQAGLAAVVTKHALPWHVVRVGARVEFICAPGPLRNGTEAGAAHQPMVEGVLHTALLNRGCLIAPFHNMMLVSPATKRRQVDRLIAAFDEILTDLCA